MKCQIPFFSEKNMEKNIYILIYRLQMSCKRSKGQLVRIFPYIKGKYSRSQSDTL